jgi:hypothetical protein
MSRRVSIFGASFVTPPLWEPETIAYMTAVGIPADSTAYYPSTAYERTGLQLWQYADTLVIALKSVGWSKFKAFWPRLGGTADRHKWNIINPVDSDAAHRNVFFGGWTHGPTGCLPNGTNGYINAHISPNQWTYNNVSFGVYNRSSLGGFKIVMGYASGLVVYWYPRADPNTYVRYGGAEIAYTQASETRLITLTQNATRLKAYRDGVLVNDSANSPSIAMQSITIPMYIQARNDGGTAVLFGNRSEAGAFVADELTASEVASVSAAMQAFNTSLGRQV